MPSAVAASSATSRTAPSTTTPAQPFFAPPRRDVAADQRPTQRAAAVDHEDAALPGLVERRLDQRVVLEALDGRDRAAGTRHAAVVAKDGRQDEEGAAGLVPLCASQRSQVEKSLLLAIVVLGVSDLPAARRLARGAIACSVVRLVITSASRLQVDQRRASRGQRRAQRRLERGGRVDARRRPASRRPGPAPRSPG